LSKLEMEIKTGRPVGGLVGGAPGGNMLAATGKKGTKADLAGHLCVPFGNTRLVPRAGGSAWIRGIWCEDQAVASNMCHRIHRGAAMAQIAASSAIRATASMACGRPSERPG